jgi:hypothetical protein
MFLYNRNNTINNSNNKVIMFKNYEITARGLYSYVFTYCGHNSNKNK